MSNVLRFPAKPVTTDRGSSSTGERHLPKQEKLQLLEADELSRLETQRQVLIDLLQREPHERPKLLARRLSSCSDASCGLAACPLCRAANDKYLVAECRRFLSSQPNCWRVFGHFRLFLDSLEEVKQFDIVQFRRQIQKSMAIVGHAKRPWRGRIEMMPEIEEAHGIRELSGCNITCCVCLHGVTRTDDGIDLRQRFEEMHMRRVDHRLSASLHKGSDVVGRHQPFREDSFPTADERYFMDQRYDDQRLGGLQKAEVAIACALGEIPYRNLLMPAAAADIRAFLP
jgi:hypothetical protein